jgi:hypothetical protein
MRIDDAPRDRIEPPPRLKKSYIEPELIEYGSIRKLTASAGSVGTDGHAGMLC